MEEAGKEIPTVFRNKKRFKINFIYAIIFLALAIGGLFFYNLIFKSILQRNTTINQNEKFIEDLRKKVKGGPVQIPPVSNISN